MFIGGLGLTDPMARRPAVQQHPANRIASQSVKDRGTEFQQLAPVRSTPKALPRSEAIDSRLTLVEQVRGILDQPGKKITTYIQRHSTPSLEVGFVNSDNFLKSTHTTLCPSMGLRIAAGSLLHQGTWLPRCRDLREQLLQHVVTVSTQNHWRTPHSPKV